MYKHDSASYMEPDSRMQARNIQVFNMERGTGDMAIKVIFLIVFFAVMVLIGVMTRRKARSVD